MLRQLAGQTAIYGISSIVARLLNFLLTPYLTNLLTTSEYGVVGDMYSIIPFALILLTMGLETGYFRFAGKASSDAERLRLFSTSWGAVTAVSLGFLAIVLLFRQPLAVAMEYSAHPWYIPVVAAIIALDAITAIPFARLRQEGRAMLFVSVRVVSIVVNVVLCVLFYSVFGMGEYGAGFVFVANLGASVVTLLMLYPAYKGLKWVFDTALIKRLLIYSTPLLLSGIAGTANEFIDRQMIKFMMPADVAMSDLGIYSAVVKIAVLMVIFTQMYRYAAEPFFLSGYAKDDFKRSNAVAMKFFVIVAVVIFLTITMFIDVFALLVGRDFRSGIFIVPILLVSNIFAGMLINLSMWYKYVEKTRFALYVTCTGLLFSVGLNVFLIPRYGYEGAAWARLGCEFAMVVLSLWLNQRYYPIKYQFGRIALYLAVGGGLYVASLSYIDAAAFVKYPLSIVLIISFIAFAMRLEKINLRTILRR